jgi:phospholipase/carboxylesterase
VSLGALRRAPVVRAVAWLLLGATLACSSERTPSQPATRVPTAREESADFTPPDPDGYGRAGELRYLEIVLGGDADDTLPMVVVIHGLGDSPGRHWLDLVQLDAPLRLIMPEAPTPYLDGFSWFTYRAATASPERLARGIARAEAQLAVALERLVRGRPTRGRPLVTGYSQGGMLSFALALAHPERIEIAVPISGMLPAPLWPKTRPSGRFPSIVALHGAADERVPYALTARLRDHLQALGYPVTLHTYEGVAHSISDEMRAQVIAALKNALPR